MKVQAMPLLLSEQYVPEIVKTERSRATFLDEHLTTSATVLEAKAYTLYTRKGSNKSVIYYAVSKGHLIYLMHLMPIRLARKDGISNRSVYQGSVWRSDRTIAAKMVNLPKSVFWSLLRPGTAIVSDSMQSQMGKLFWQRRMNEALDKGLIVEALHLRDGDPIRVGKVVQLTDGDSLEKFRTPDTDMRGLSWRFRIRKP